MKHAVTRDLYGYWDGLRAGRAAPERSDIDPVMIRGILSDTFILESDHLSVAPRFPIRLSGTRLNAFLLSELKGTSLLALFDKADRADLVRIIHCVLDQRAPVLLGLRAAPEGHRCTELEMLLLPLRHHGKTHSRILGAAAPFEVPSWLGLVPIAHFTLSSLRFVDGAARPDGRVPDAGPLRSNAPKRHRYLTVHDGGRAAHSI